MEKVLGFIQVPPTLPQSVDPQVRNFLQQLQIELRGWADDATRDINDLLNWYWALEPSGRGVPVTLEQLQRDIVALADRIAKLEMP